MSIYEKTKIKITDDIVNKYKETNPYVVKVNFSVSALNTEHEMLVIPRNYEQYSNSVKTLLKSHNDETKIDPLLEGAKLTLMNQIIYPELVDDDFNPDKNPADFIYSLAAKYQDMWDPVFTDIKYYDLPFDPDENDKFFKMYDEKLTEIKKEHPFAYGLKFENQFGVKSFFIVNKLTNNEKLYFLNDQKKFQERLFTETFGKYSESIKSILNLSTNSVGTIDAVIFDDKRKAIALDETITLDVLADVSRYNDEIYFSMIEYNYKPFRDFLEKKIYFSYPMSISEVVPNIMFYIYNDILSSFDITKSIDLNKAKFIIEEFTKKHNIENVEETHQLIRKVSQVINE